VKILTVLGARPQFIKAAAVSRAIRSQNASGGHPIREVIVHTGQHFDANMSDVFFTQLDIPKPDHHLGVSGMSHGAMTGRMLEGIEALIQSEKPDWVLVYGDTNSTLAGALAAAKLHVPIAHVEAGLRSFNMRMPEEVNRIVADRVSTLLLCPTDTAIENLRAEGVTKGVHNVGDVMFDVSLFYRERARAESGILGQLSLREGNFALMTCHRAENTDDPARLAGIVTAVSAIAKRMPVVLPIHPRTRKLLETNGLTAKLEGVTVTEPLGYLDMVALEQAASVILTDSGGVQKEAFFYRVPCITMRDETEWVETVQCGANRLTGASTSAIMEAFDHVVSNGGFSSDSQPYGRGAAARAIISILQGIRT
jgi:UDP-GlcNAc3NAcA epimerase